MTTKDQEKQAIAKIRRIVEGLGENSYVGFAMDGVLEVAEQNIEDDAAYSMKERMENAQRREQKQREIAEKLEEELKATKVELAQSKEWWKEQQVDLKKQLQQAQTLAERYKIPENMYKSLWLIVSDEEEGAAKRFRKHMARIQECKMLLEMLESKYEEKEEKGNVEI